ncbi:uncharacterized protein LOC126824711 [Patella vulgata]|uniref:uncharacterized protein LOC126824711 n=1 Tax=Patella vulgata TaxID=6465 RepID=UPI002180021D|nr:uncharacterized protein LOC126824711 [Patella vulgata]XP_050410003.1 uncharacterized protein LOC126824711 [Patella vulgata]
MCLNNNYQLINKISKDWHGLLKALSSPNNQLKAAEDWIKDVMSCGYETKPNWTTLLSELVDIEPKVETDQLVFKPRIVLLSSDIQRLLMAVFFHHRHSISCTALHVFLTKIKPHLRSESWMMKLHVMLTKHVQSTVTSLSMYKFSWCNSQLYQSLLKSLKNSEDHIPWQKSQAQLSELFCCLDKDDVKFSQEESSNLYDNDVEMIEHNYKQSAKGITCGDSVQSVNSPEKLTPIVSQMSQCIVISSSSEEEEEETEPKNSGTRKRKQQDSPEEPPAKRTREASDEDTKIDLFANLTADDKLKINNLKDGWRCGQKDSSLNFNIFVTSNPQQVGSICVYIGISDYDEECLTTACEDLLSNSAIIPYDNTIVFMEYAIKEKFIDITQTPTRVFASVMMDLCKVFPKQFIDIVSKIITEKPINVYQSEIICRICSESMEERDHQYFIRIMVATPRVIDEPIISILQSLIELKVDISPDVTIDLIGCLSLSRTQLSTSKKFGKFLLHFINKYGKQFQTSELSSMAVILDSHSTFLKKAAELAFKKFNSL